MHYVHHLVREEIEGGMGCSQGNCGCYTAALAVFDALQVLLTPFLSFLPNPPLPKGTGGSDKQARVRSHSLVGVWSGIGSTPHFSVPERLK